MPPGDYPRRVTVLQPDPPTKDESGAPLTDWPIFTVVWARREPLRGRELWQAMQVKEQVPVRYTVRGLHGITPRMRLLDGGQMYDIQSAEPDEKRQETALLCEEIL